jgi:hypothetical protein
MLEYWNIDVVGFERINPSFHRSTLPIFRTGVRRLSATKHMRLSAARHSVPGPAYQRTNADDTEKQLVNGNIVGRSDLAKRTREQ